MAEAYTTEALIATARESFINIGYHEQLLQEQYSFADIFAPDEHLRSVELAAFAQEPPTYRNVCFGFVTPYDDSPEAIMAYRALGAPQLFALHPQKGKIHHWQIRAREMPELIGATEPTNLRNVILAHRDEWKPEHIFRAKSIRFMSEPVQLDFFDVGLIPTLEDRVYEKLSRLLNDVIATCKVVYVEHHDHDPDYKALFRLIFRLVAAKLLRDRQHQGAWLGCAYNILL